MKHVSQSINIYYLRKVFTVILYKQDSSKGLGFLRPELLPLSNTHKQTSYNEINMIMQNERGQMLPGQGKMGGNTPFTRKCRNKKCKHLRDQLSGHHRDVCNRLN